MTTVIKFSYFTLFEIMHVMVCFHSSLIVLFASALCDLCFWAQFCFFLIHFGPIWHLKTTCLAGGGGRVLPIRHVCPIVPSGVVPPSPKNKVVPKGTILIFFTIFLATLWLFPRFTYLISLFLPFLFLFSFITYLEPPNDSSILYTPLQIESNSFIKSVWQNCHPKEQQKHTK